MGKRAIVAGLIVTVAAAVSAIALMLLAGTKVVRVEGNDRGAMSP